MSYNAYNRWANSRADWQRVQDNYGTREEWLHGHGGRGGVGYERAGQLWKPDDQVGEAVFGYGPDVVRIPLYGSVQSNIADVPIDRHETMRPKELSTVSGLTLDESYVDHMLRKVLACECKEVDDPMVIDAVGSPMHVDDEGVWVKKGPGTGSGGSGGGGGVIPRVRINAANPNSGSGVAAGANIQSLLPTLLSSVTKGIGPLHTTTVADAVGITAFRKERLLNKQAAQAAAAFRGIDSMDSDHIFCEAKVSLKEACLQKVGQVFGETKKHNCRHRSANRFYRRVAIVKRLVDKVRFGAPCIFTASDADRRSLRLAVKRVVEDASKDGIEVGGSMSFIRDQEKAWYLKAVCVSYYIREEDDEFWDRLAEVGQATTA